jgi:hypothetical protein
MTRIKLSSFLSCTTYWHLQLLLFTHTHHKWQWFAISTSPWQHLDQFEFFPFAKVIKGIFFPFS